MWSPPALGLMTVKAEDESEEVVEKEDSTELASEDEGIPEVQEATSEGEETEAEEVLETEELPVEEVPAESEEATEVGEEEVLEEEVPTNKEVVEPSKEDEETIEELTEVVDKETIRRTAKNAGSTTKNAGVSSWEELKDAIEEGGEQTIILGEDFAYDGTSIEIPSGSKITITGDATIYSTNADKYQSMFVVKGGGKLIIDEGITLSGKVSLDENGCPTNDTYTSDKFTGEVSGNTYDPKGFFIEVEPNGTATLNGTISDFVTSRTKDKTPRYVAPVVADGSNATFDIGTTGVIKNNLVGYIVDDKKANNDAQTIKMYIKGAGPNVPRVPNAATQQANKAAFDGRPRTREAGIDGGAPGTGITATAGAVIYKDGAKGTVQGTIYNNRADTGGIMASGDGTQVNIKNGTSITNNVGVQFGGGSTAEQGGSILMQGGVMAKNVAWFGGGAVYVTENGVDWLQGRMSGSDLLHPDFDARKDGVFFMEGGELTENTAFTRGGAVLADSDGVNIQAGKLSYNMSRMLGGAMYVMGDHPKYEYTVFMTKLYVHDNAAVSGEAAARNATTKQPDSQILRDQWGGDDWNTLNQPMQTLLQAPKTCGDLSGDDILSGSVTFTHAGGNTDDYMDGKGAQGTGGGVWLCAYGNTVFEANEPNKVVITNNYATGAPKIGSGGYHSNMLAGDIADANNNSNPSSDSRSGITAGSDFHADTGGKGTVVINGLTDEGVNWVNENTGEKYESTVSGGRLNLVNKNESIQPTDVAVEVVGNLARHGGGLAADGTYYFGTLASQATPGATIEVEKVWANSTAQKPITIRATVSTSKGDVVLADVPLDGEANPPASEFDTVQELDPAGITWKGEFGFPMSTHTDSGETVKLYTLVYAGSEDILIPNTSDWLTADTELDPLSYKGRVALAAVLEADKADDIKVLFGEPEYATIGELRKVDKNDDGTYKVTPITISYTELEENENGELVPCDDYIFIPEEMDLAKLKYKINATPKYKTTIDADGNIVETSEVLYTIHLFSIPLTAPMTNDNWPITEKYVNKDVHSEIVNFDQEFTYDILAYVPVSATEFTITDELVEGLEFADKDGNPSTDPWAVVQSVAVKYANNHEVGDEGTVVSGDIVKTDTSGTPIDFIRWEKGWPADEGYPSTWVTAWPNKGYGPQMSIEGNKLTIKIDELGYENGGNNPFDLQQARGRWVQVTFTARIKDEYRNLDALKELEANVSGKTTSWEETDTNKQAPDARDLTFANGDLNIVKALEEIIGPDPIAWAVEAPSRLFARSERGVYYATPMDDKSGNIWGLLEEGTPDWTNADNRYNGVPPEANNTRRQIDLGDGLLAALDNQPKVKGGVIQAAAEGPGRYFARVVDGYGDTVYYQSDPLNDKTGAKWILCATEGEKNNAIKKLSGDNETIRLLDLESDSFTLYVDSKNWPVISEEEHEGMANQAQYDVKFGNGAEGSYKTNTVTVKPETTKIYVQKKWEDKGGNELPEWPEGLSVDVNVYKNIEGAQPEVLEVINITNIDKYSSKEYPKLKGVTYTVDEVVVPEGYSKEPIKGQGTSDDPYIIINTQEEQPEIEKYINTNVHEFVDLEEVFTYDIIAYVTKDADKVTILDELNEQLQFAKSGAEVKVYDLGTTNNHKTTDKASEDSATATVTTGKDITEKASITTEGNNLTVVLDDVVTVDKEAGTITREKEDVVGLRGHWIRVEFKAQLADGLDIESLATEVIEDNAPLEVTDAQANHEGVPNKAKYTIEVGNEAKYEDESNTVTVKPKELIDIEVTKTWDDIDNLEELRPSEVIVNLMANGDIVASATISEKDGWKYVFKDIEKGPEYTIEEEVVSYYVAEITGDVEEGFEIINHYRSYLPGKRKITSEETGEFTLSKTAEENVSKEIEFTFKVKMLIEEEGSETRTFEETVKLKVGESKTYDFVAEGTEVEIVEVDANNYEITYYLEDAIISKPIFVVEKDGQHAFNVHNKIKPARKPSVPTTGVK